jgi:hypothetical protein
VNVARAARSRPDQDPPGPGVLAPGMRTGAARWQAGAMLAQERPDGRTKTHGPAPASSREMVYEMTTWRSVSYSSAGSIKLPRSLAGFCVCYGVAAGQGFPVKCCGGFGPSVLLLGENGTGERTMESRPGNKPTAPARRRSSLFRRSRGLLLHTGPQISRGKRGRPGRHRVPHPGGRRRAGTSPPGQY